MSSPEFRRLLEEGRLAELRQYWSKHCQGLPQAESDDQAEIMMHYARTEARSITLPARCWSHAWLVERGLPSALPDELKPKAAQLHPVRKVAVGISVNFRNPHLRAAGEEIRQAMEAAVLDADADGRIEDAAFVSSRMAEARTRTMRALFGR